MAASCNCTSVCCRSIQPSSLQLDWWLLIPSGPIRMFWRMLLYRGGSPHWEILSVKDMLHMTHSPGVMSSCMLTPSVIRICSCMSPSCPATDQGYCKTIDCSLGAMLMYLYYCCVLPDKEKMFCKLFHAGLIKLHWFDLQQQFHITHGVFCFLNKMLIMLSQCWKCWS